MATMRAVDLIERKRDGGELSSEEIRWLLDGYVKGDVPDYQMAAWLMAVCVRGMSEGETVALTRAMVESGGQIDLSSLPGRKVDKHSTGGGGDTVTLVLVPLMAAAGLVCVKMSGRSLGHTGGTIDKLEAIPGLRTELTMAELLSQADRLGCVVADHTSELVPADRLLYELRDVTGTVPSIPLIAGSILSKKLAGGADAIVLDVKCGDGAFMRRHEDARELARTLVSVGNRLGKMFSALITSMEQPLGRMAGNALEVRQAIDVLTGAGPGDLREVVLALGGELLVLSGEARSADEARERLVSLLEGQEAWNKFRSLVVAQGGDVEAVDNPELLPRAMRVVEVRAERGGYVEKLAARAVGQAAGMVGAGREVKGQAVDLGAGVELLAKVGDEVVRGQPLARLHIGRPDRYEEAHAVLEGAFRIASERPGPPALVIERLP